MKAQCAKMCPSWLNVLLTFCVLVLHLHVGHGQDKRCNVPADVIFLMDASDSIKQAEWEQEKEFVSILIDNLEVDRYAIHVGVIVYSTGIGQVIDLQPFKTKTELKDLLQKAEHMDQGTNTANAISQMIAMSDSQGRFDMGATQIGVIITDGKSVNVSATIWEAQRARNEFNMDIIAIGVGNQTFYGELAELAGREHPDRLFQVSDFAELKEKVVPQLEDIICEIVFTTPTPETSPTTTSTTTQSTTSPFVPDFPCSDPADVVFLIDGSLSIKPPDWDKEKQFVSYLINSIDVGISSINVGIVVFGTDIGNVVDLIPFRGKTDLKNAALALTQPRLAATNTALGLQTVRTMLATQGRDNVPHIAIVITDGMSSKPAETRTQATLAKQEGIGIFVVGVGITERSEVEFMASSSQTLFDAPNFEGLVNILQVLRDNVCRVIGNITTTTSSTTTTTPSTTPPPIPELCKQCLVEGGVGFNPMPDDCEKYVMCLPKGLTYEPQIKSCPFGMFWSNEAVSCLDARYVECPVDRCKALSNAQTYSSGTSGCRNYFRCSNGRSTPVCCEAGFRYVEGGGCSRDVTCQDSCPLNVTIYNQGACRFRPDPDTYYGYLEVVPGRGHVKVTCEAGQVYSQDQCGCTYDAALVIPDIVCSSDVHLAFNGSFEDSSPRQQPITVHRVALTKTGSAYFSGDSYLTVPTTANKDFGDQLVIKMKFRVKEPGSPRQPWNNNWAGFQHWFNNATDHGSQFNVVTGRQEVTLPDPGNIPGAESKPREVITIGKDGTIIRDPRYVVNVSMTWPDGTQPVGDVIHLGNLGSLTTPKIMNGIVYMPNGRNQILIQESRGGVTGSVTNVWKVVSVSSDGRTGSVVDQGQGAVPLSIQQSYGFDLRPPLVERWFIVAPGGIIFEQGEGTIPDDVINRYAGFTPGILVKLFERGDAIERWQMSKPDGSQQQSGTGSIPQSLVTANKLDKILLPAQMAKTWALMAADGTVLDVGEGDVPASVLQKYKSDPSITILISISKDGHPPYWQITRPSGVKVVEGRGSLPSGISSFIQGTILIPQISSIRRWTVTLPDGTVKSGTGPIPQDILDMFRQYYGASRQGGQAGGQLSRRWTVTLADGSTRTGEGEIPADIRAMMSSNDPTLSKSWQVTMPDGTVKSGVGDMPADLLAMMRSQGKRKRRAAHTTNEMDLLSNCGSAPTMTPSMHLYTTHHDVTFRLMTSQSPNGVSVSLPIHPGMNEVMFMYDGKHLSGVVDGAIRRMPLLGKIQTKVAPVMIGQCLLRNQNHFIGEIDMFEMYHCLP